MMEQSIQITRGRHAWAEPAGFVLSRPHGLVREYTFLHFFNCVEIEIDGKPVKTKPGACIFYDIQKPQWFQSNERLEHDWMHMTGAVPAALETVGLELNRLYYPQQRLFITRIMREIEEELLTRPDHCEYLLQTKFQELLIKLARSCRESTPESVIKPETKLRFREIRQQMFSQVRHDWTVAELAELACLSPSRFHSVYRALFHISPIDDLIRARIEMANIRLCDSDISIQNLAEELGYQNITHFCRQYKQLTGVTPGQYRTMQTGESYPAGRER